MYAIMKTAMTAEEAMRLAECGFTVARTIHAFGIKKGRPSAALSVDLSERVTGRCDCGRLDP